MAINGFLRRTAPTIGVAAVVVVLLVAAFLIEISRQAVADYARAVPCGSYAGAGSNCFDDVSAHITSVVFTAGESSTNRPLGIYTIVLTDGQNQWTAQVSQSLVVRAPMVGQQINARVWRGIVTQVTSNGVSVQTLSYPTSYGGGWALLIIGAVLATIIGASALSLLKRPRPREAGAFRPLRQRGHHS